MSTMLMQVLNKGVYSSVDNNLLEAVSLSDKYIDKMMRRTEIKTENGIYIFERIQPFEEKNEDKLLSIDVLFYDASGKLWTTNSHSEFQTLSLNPFNIGKVFSGELQTYYGDLEEFRAITIRVHDENYKDIEYATFIVATTQLKEAQIRTQKIVIIIMVIFWLISSVTSLYLSKWTRRPILENYERQKTFVENASHELKTPLAVLQNRLETLFRRPTSTVLDNSEIIASSLEEVRNMNILTKNLLDLARRSEGLSPKMASITPDYFNDVLDNFHFIAKEVDKAFIGNNLLTTPIISDKDLLRQLLTILFDNAIKYTGEDGRIEMTLISNDKHLLISVRDNGLGIPDDHKKKVFDRFYRVDKARTRQNGGFGLGLSLAQQIVASLNGSITIQDNIPKGTIFKVKL